MEDNNLPAASSNSILLYVTEGGKVRIEVKMQDETVWLTQDQMAQLFDKSKSTINEHIKNIYAEKELSEEQAMRKFGISEFSTKPTNYYNLDMIISVGYRVNSLRGTQFRIWATQRLREYIVKGFTMDDERLKQAVATILTNCLPVSVIFVRRRRFSGARCWIFTLPALTIRQTSKYPKSFSGSFRIKCTGRLMAIQPLKLLRCGLIRHCLIWGLPHGRAINRGTWTQRRRIFYLNRLSGF